MYIHIYIYVYVYVIYMYEDINILCTLFRFPRCYFRCRHEHAPSFFCPGIEGLAQKKLEILICPKLCYAGYKISANYPLFLIIKLDRNKTISIFVVHSRNSKN